MMKQSIRFLATISIALISHLLQAQDGYYVDALRYSNNGITGSARIQALGGAAAALGADLGSVYTNPAGLGYYRKSEIGASADVMASLSASTPQGSTFSGVKNNDFQLNFNIPNLGLAICLGKNDPVDSKWKSGTIALTQTRIANFQNSFTYVGNNTGNSLLTNIDSVLSGYNSSNFHSNNITSIYDLAWNSYLIDNVPQRDSNGNLQYDSQGHVIRYTDAYHDYWPDNLSSVKQQETFSTQGSMSEWNLSYGGNYADRFYFGASVGIVGLRYTQSKSYQETSNLQNDPGLKGFNYNESLSVNGTGVNLTLGINYKIADFLRMGLSFKTPSNIWISETENQSVQSTMNNYGILNTLAINGDSLNSSYSSQTLTRNFNYSMVTPFRANYGVAVFIKKYGFITADIEYLDYGTSSLNTSNGDAQFINANNSIATLFKQALNLKGGVEIRIENFRIRGGYSWFGSPNSSTINDSSQRIRSGASTNITGGIGFRMENYFIDLTYVNTSYQSAYSPYILSDGSQPVVSVKNNFSNFIVSGGFNF